MTLMFIRFVAAFIITYVRIIECHIDERIDPDVVPSLVHQVYDYKQPSFFFYLSVKSVQYYMKPAKHFLWVNDEGRYRMGFWNNWLNDATDPTTWQYDLKQMIENKKITPMFTTFPYHPPNNDTLYVPNHAFRSDFVRMNALLQYGGFYLDTDAFVVDSLQEFRKFHFTISFDNVVEDTSFPKRLNNGVLFASPNASFTRLWMSHYSYFAGYSWNQQIYIPFLLAASHPDLVHIEMSRISPISYGLHTALAAQYLTCGILLPEKRAIWAPRYDENLKQYTFENTQPNYYVYEALRIKLVLHLTMSGERWYCLLRKYLHSLQQVKDIFPSLLGHYFRKMLFDRDEFDYSSLDENHASNEDRLKIWNKCRDELGIQIIPERDIRDLGRQQYIHPIE